ncbi:MAG: DUF4426 domain-containing protein [Steroidobacteraceae bacterium]
MKKYLSIASLISIAILLAACNRQPSAEIQPALTSNESFQVSDTHEMHYNAVRTDQLTTDIARAYGIERSKNKVLLNISVLSKTAEGGTTPSDADVTVLARNLNGQLKNVQLRRIAESTAIYYIAEVDFSGSETLVFEIKAMPTGSNSPLTATLTREFFAD